MNAVFTAALGKASICESQFGWHILLVSERGDGPRAIIAPDRKVGMKELEIKAPAESDDAGRSL